MLGGCNSCNSQNKVCMRSCCSVLGDVRMLTGSDDTWMMHFSDVLIVSNLLKWGPFLDWVIAMSMYRDVFLMRVDASGIGEARSIKWHLIDVLPIIEEQVLISNCQFLLHTGFWKDKGKMITEVWREMDACFCICLYFPVFLETIAFLSSYHGSI